MNRNRLIAHIRAAPQLLVAWMEDRGYADILSDYYYAKCAPSDEEQMHVLTHIRDELDDICYERSDAAKSIASEIEMKRDEIEMKRGYSEGPK